MARLRRGLVLCLLFAWMSALSGCWVFSVYPLAGPDDEVVFDKLLTGNWWNAQNKCSVSFARLPDEKAYRVAYMTGKEAGDGCWLGQNSSASFAGTLVELGGGRVLDVVPADLPLQNHMLLTHSFYRLKVDNTSLSITPMNYELVEGLMRQDKLHGVMRSDDVMVLTATTAELREFFRQNAGNANLWQEGRKLEFQRRFEGQ